MHTTSMDLIGKFDEHPYITARLNFPHSERHDDSPFFLGSLGTITA